jgi:hypothetical protein
MRSIGNGQDWPQWRGPSRNGIFPQTLPWPDKLPKPSWTAPVGIGYSSPIIADGRVYCIVAQCASVVVCSEVRT